MDDPPVRILAPVPQPTPQTAISNPMPAQTTLRSTVTKPTPAEAPSQASIIVSIQTGDPMITTACNAGPDASMPDIADGAQDPTQDHRASEWLFVSPGPPPPPPISPSPNPQAATHLRHESPNMSTENKSQDGRKHQISEETGYIILGLIRLAASVYHGLDHAEKVLLAEERPYLRKEMRELANAMTPMVLGGSSSRSRKRKSDDLVFQPAENGFESLPPKRSFIKGRSNRSIASPASDSESEGTKIEFEEFQELCYPERGGNTKPMPYATENAAFKFCNKIARADFCTKVVEFAKDESQSTWNNTPTSVANGLTTRDDHIRKKAIKQLMESIHEYEGSEEQPPPFYKIWDNLTLADLVAPDWETYCKRNEKNGKSSHNFVWWAWKVWLGEWEKICDQNRWSKISRFFADKRAVNMREGWYWRQWCRSLLDNKSDIDHRGALLLLSAVSVSEELNDQQLELAKTYIPKRLTWVTKAAKMLSPFALRMYQSGLNNQQELDSLKESLRGIQTDPGCFAEAASEATDESNVLNGR
jgi:hypothetical protein